MALALKLSSPEVGARLLELDATDELLPILKEEAREELGSKWTDDHGLHALHLRLLADKAMELARASA